MAHGPMGNKGTQQMELREQTGIAPELKVGLYYCVLIFALSTVVYLLC